MITQIDARDIMGKVFVECDDLRKAGQAEYAHDPGNALANFERVAREVGITREQSLLVFLGKHMDGIKAWVKGHKSQRESVKGRINDAIVYLVLLRCMVEDGEKPEIAPDSYNPRVPSVREVREDSMNRV